MTLLSHYSAPKGGMLLAFAIDGKVDEGDLYNTEVIEKMLRKQRPPRGGLS